MMHELFIKAAVSFIAIPLASFVGEVAAQMGDSDAGMLIEKFGIIGAGIIFFTYAIKWFKADKEERQEREKALAVLLETERKAHNESLDKLNGTLDKLSDAIQGSCRFDKR